MLKKLCLVAVAAIAMSGIGRAQILVSFYNSSSPDFQSPATVADFGITTLPTPSTVTGFDIGPTLTEFGSLFSTTLPSSSGAAVTLSSNFVAASYPSPTYGVGGVYQAALFYYPLNLGVSGLSSVLAPNTTYDLILYTVSIFAPSQATSSASYSYGTDSGSKVFTGKQDLVSFQFDTGSTVSDFLNLDFAGISNSSYPGLTAFAIVAAPEPSSVVLGLIVLGFIAVEIRRRHRAVTI